MPEFRTFIRSFAGGELTPSLKGRIDLDKYQIGLQRCENFISYPHGPLSRRPGFLKFRYSIRPDKPGRILLVQHPSGGEGGALLVELTPSFIAVQDPTSGRFFAPPGAAVVSASFVLTAGEILVTFPSSYTGLNFYLTSFVSNAPDTLIGREVFKLSHVSGSTYKLLLLDGTPVKNYPPLNGVAATMLLQPVHFVPQITESRIPKLKFLQYDTSLMIFHPEMATLVIDFDYNSFSFSVNTLALGPKISPPTGVTATAVSGSGSQTYRYCVTAISDTLEESGESGVATVDNDLSLAGNKNKITWVNSPGAIRYNVYKDFNGVFGYIGQASDGAVGFIDDNIRTDMKLTPPSVLPALASSALLPPSAPACGTFYEGRLWLASTAGLHRRVACTRAGTAHNPMRSIPQRDDDAFSIVPRSLAAGAIRHLVPLRNLVVLTASDEFDISSGGADVLTPSTVTVTPLSYIGASDVRPIIFNNLLLYVDSTKTKIREIVYNQDAYSNNDLTLLAPHLFERYAITSIALQYMPFPIIWAVRNDGVLLGCTYVPEQKVVAWHQHHTDGHIEDVSVGVFTDRDFVFTRTIRDVGGIATRMIEFFSIYHALDGDLRINVDSSIYAMNTSDISTMYGMWHLRGKTVAIYSNKGVQPSSVVGADGSLTLPQPAKLVCVGLPYTSIAHTLPLLLEAPAFGLVDQKTVLDVFVHVHQSSIAKFGASLNSLYELRVRTTEPHGSPTSFVTDVLRVGVNFTWDEDLALYFVQDYPLPLTILSVGIKGEI